MHRVRQARLTPARFAVPFLGAFAHLPKSAISFVMSVRLSVRVDQLGCNGWIFAKFDV
jgi:hypothetical protein